MFKKKKKLKKSLYKQGQTVEAIVFGREQNDRFYVLGKIVNVIENVVYMTEVNRTHFGQDYVIAVSEEYICKVVS